MTARFRDDGIVVLRSAFESDDASVLRDMIWRHIESSTPVRLGDPRTWRYDGNFGLRAVEERSIWHPVHTNSAVVSALEEIFGPNGWAAPGAPQVLLTFPGPDRWSMPAGWHIDFGEELPTWPVYAVKMFALLDTVEPEGGGTLLLRGSHRLAAGANHPYLKRLFAGGERRAVLDDAIEIDGVEVQPIEITGGPGDIFLTHMQVLHSPAANVLQRPRQMLGNAFRRRP